MRLKHRGISADAGRRRFLTGAGALLAAPLAHGQAKAALPRIGVLLTNEPGTLSHYLEAFTQGLRELGQVEGRTFAFEYRWARGRLDALPALADELVRQKVQVIFAATAPAALAARDATSTIPVVFAQVNDPVGLKLVASLPRPGGNVTGVSTINLELIGKRLELLREVTQGKASRLAILFNPKDASNVIALKETERVARVLGASLVPLPAASGEEFAGAFSRLRAERVEGLQVAAGSLTNSHAARIVELAAAAGVPTVYASREFVDAGGLMSYSAIFSDSYHRAAAYVDRILKGAKPGDLPVEQATRFELAINLRTARALGLAIPPAVRLRADRLID